MQNTITNTETNTDTNIDTNTNTDTNTDTNVGIKCVPPDWTTHKTADKQSCHQLPAPLSISFPQGIESQ